jgi:hypothetical protein
LTRDAHDRAAPWTDVDGGVREFLEERVGFAIDDAVALLDHGTPDGLATWLFPVTGEGRSIVGFVTEVGDELADRSS